MFTLHEFIHDYCKNDPAQLQQQEDILLQAIMDGRLISRYSQLFKDRITTVQTYLQNYESIPGIVQDDSKSINVEMIILHILICLLAGYTSDDAVKHIPIYNPTLEYIFGQNDFWVNVQHVPKEFIYYYQIR